MTTAIRLSLKRGTSYPTAENPRQRFEKRLEDAPWRQSVSVSIELDDPAWEMLGYPQELTVEIGS